MRGSRALTSVKLSGNIPGEKSWSRASITLGSEEKPPAGSSSAQRTLRGSWEVPSRPRTRNGRAGGCARRARRVSADRRCRRPRRLLRRRCAAIFIRLRAHAPSLPSLHSFPALRLRPPHTLCAAERIRPMSAASYEDKLDLVEQDAEARQDREQHLHPTASPEAPPVQVSTCVIFPSTVPGSAIGIHGRRERSACSGRTRAARRSH